MGGNARTAASVVLMAVLVACSAGEGDVEPVSFAVDEATEVELVIEQWDDFDRLYAGVAVPTDADEQRLIEVATGAVAQLRSEHDYAALMLTLRAEEPTWDPGMPVGHIVDAPGPDLLSEEVRVDLEGSFASAQSAYFQGALEVDRTLGDYQGNRVVMTLEQPDWQQRPSSEQWQRYQEVAERYATRHAESFAEDGIVWRDDEIELAREVAADVAVDLEMDGDALWSEVEQTRGWVLDRSTTSVTCATEGEQERPVSFQCEFQ
jgi:hypothetical protein